jgi:hypothetical protein
MALLRKRNKIWAIPKRVDDPKRIRGAEDSRIQVK